MATGDVLVINDGIFCDIFAEYFDFAISYRIAGKFQDAGKLLVNFTIQCENCKWIVDLKSGVSIFSLSSK